MEYLLQILHFLIVSSGILHTVTLSLYLRVLPSGGYSATLHNLTDLNSIFRQISEKDTTHPTAIVVSFVNSNAGKLDVVLVCSDSNLR